MIIYNILVTYSIYISERNKVLLVFFTMLILANSYGKMPVLFLGSKRFPLSICNIKQIYLTKMKICFDSFNGKQNL